MKRAYHGFLAFVFAFLVYTAEIIIKPATRVRRLFLPAIRAEKFVKNGGSRKSPISSFN